jgi:chemotaxis protein MotB
VAPVLLAGCVWQSDYDALAAKNRQLEQQVAADANEKRQLQGQVAAGQQQIAADKVMIDRLTNAVRYTVNSDLLFPSGGWQLSAEGQKVIGRVASQLAPGQVRKVVVNGYTDNQPIGRDLQRRGIATNQDLSQRRAETVMQYLVSQGVKADMVTASGHGESDPIASNDNAAGRAQNRRVEITLAGS